MDPLFEMKEFEARLSKLSKELEVVDYAFLFNRADLFYYSGAGYDGMLAVNDSITRYVRRNIAIAREELVSQNVSAMPSYRVFKRIAKENPVKTIGLETDILPYKTVEYIRKAFGNPEIVDISTSLRRIRSVKSKREQEILKMACKQTDESFEFIEDKIKPGISELELSADIEHFLRNQGHPGFVQVRMFHHNLTSLAYVMSGQNTSTLNSMFGPVSGIGLCKMHKNGPSKRKIKQDEAVLIDTTGVVEGYTADETRTFFTGKVSENLGQAYEVAKMVQEKCQELFRPNKLPGEIYYSLFDFVSDEGFLDQFMGKKEDKVPFIGHGVGLELDEFPIISDKYNFPLEEGNCIAMEPKLIFDSTGVGIEDTWIVGSNGGIKITNHPW